MMEENLSSLENNLSNGPTTAATDDQKSTVSSPAANIDPGKNPISEIGNDKGNSAVKLTKSKKRKKKNASLEPLDNRKDTENEPYTGKTASVDAKSSVSRMEIENENENGAATLTLLEIKKLRRLLRLEEKKLGNKKSNESLDKREDSGNTNGKPNTDTITATVYQKMSVLSQAVTGDEKSSISGIENGADKLSRPQKWIMENLLKLEDEKLVNKESNAKDSENTISKLNDGVGAAETVENNVNDVVKMSKREARKMRKLVENEKNANLKFLDKKDDTESQPNTGTTATATATASVDQKMTVASLTANCDGKSLTENGKENGVFTFAKWDKTIKKRKTEKLVKKESNGSLESLDKVKDVENTVSKLNDCVGQTETVENNGIDVVKMSKRLKRKMRKLAENEKNENLESLDKKDDTKSKPNTGTTATASVDQKTTVTGLTANCDEKSSIENEKENDALKFKRDEMKKKGRDIIVMKRKNSGKEKNCLPTLGEILNPNYLQNLTQGGKRQKTENRNPAVAASEIIKTCENTQDKVTDLGTSKVLEEINCQIVTDKTVIPDAKMVSDITQEKKKSPTLAEILNPQNLEAVKCETDLNTTATDATSASKKRKKQKLKKNDINESTQDNKDSCTNKDIQALNTDLEIENFPEIVSVEKGPKTIEKEVVNNEVVENTELPKKKQKTVDSDTVKITEIKEMNNVAILGKKLVIFDVNGFLADIVSPRPTDAVADKYVPRRAIFKRPFLHDFLCFCFERFNVGIWSSRTQKNLEVALDFLLGDLKKKLLFIWDGSKCTNTRKRSLEDKYKFVVLKDLRKIWDENGPHNSWVKGTFNESNTLLVDDSPYKALINPKHTCVFPFSYSYKNRDTDDFLRPKGELQTYLEGVAATDDLKTYVEQHPFGQPAIDQTDPNWKFYSRVLEGQNRKKQPRRS